LITDCPSAAESLANISQSILSCFDIHCPSKTKSFVPKAVKKFVSVENEVKLTERDKAYQGFLREPSISNYELHADLKKSVVKSHFEPSLSLKAIRAE
jgi:hypothetical protein